ncbi:MAG: hypothetical protein HPY53_11050 [Brevinematales bacterium]|nr:hypothetical protein [Brevinematales bacterium]
MELEKYLFMCGNTLGEFYFLNRHFDTKANFTTLSYDSVFGNWRRDMFRKFREVTLNMHWGNNSKKIGENQIFLDIIHTTQYLFEIKYVFGKESEVPYKDFLIDVGRKIRYFDAFVLDFKMTASTMTTDFEREFYEWKKKAPLTNIETTLDIQWEKKSKVISENNIFYNIIYKDEYLFQIKYYFDSEKNCFIKQIEEIL